MDAHLKSRLQAIQAVISSTSGILYNNQDIIGTVDGKPFKGLLRSHYDGQGVSLLRAIGIKIAFVTVDPVDPTDPVCAMVERWNSLPSSAKAAGWPHVALFGSVVGAEQIPPVEQWLERSNLSFTDCAVMGHDLVQVPLMRKAAFRVVPAQAEKVVQQMADYITERPGGGGAFRDFANLILEAREIDPTTLPTRSERRSMFENLFSLKGKTALITGGAGYFGKLFVRGLLESGSDRVIIVEKPGGKYEEIRDVLDRDFPGRVSWRFVNLYDDLATDVVYEDIIHEYGRVDILVNNAFEFSPRTGFAPDRSGVFNQALLSQLELSFKSGVAWAFQATQKFGMEMKASGAGSIINIASPAGVRSIDPAQYEGFEHTPNPPGYGIAKAALIQLTRISAMNLAPVRVNALSPGAIPNPEEQHDRAGKSYQDKFLDTLAQRMALRRNGRPEELVGGLIYLASDASSYVTGQNLLIDGGWTIHL
jgi:NAD(P)-dependent dehydrogenase (short-subunit alcohol dehydrogenase family)/3-deoxy-D-manno-octulosonate 8-phosphate phosphatase KdsC-like HAD superfamily phosphatase